MDEQIIYKDGQKYRVRTETGCLGNKPITVTHYTPVLSPKEYERRRREIETRLYNVFIKYVKPTKGSID